MGERGGIRRGRVRTAAGIATAGLVVTGALVLPGLASAQEAAPSTGGIHPGRVTETEGGGACTSNFVYTAGGRTFLGQAAHCAGTGDSTVVDGCTAATMPLGTPVRIEGASRPGTLAYSSWVTMQADGETDPDACMFNDLGLVEIDPADVGSVAPDVPVLGGPTGLDTDGTVLGEKVYSYGNSPLRGGVSELSPKTGVSSGDVGNGWSHEVVTLTPGVPGDSGSGFLDADGEAIGVLSTLNLAPVPGSNGISDLAKMLAYASEHGDLGPVELVTGTTPFTP